MNPPSPSPGPSSDGLPFLEFAPRPLPAAALARLYQEARGRSGGSQAARSLLFWLGGEKDPTGYAGSGGLELRRLDAKNRQAALDVINWWALPEDSDRLFDVLESLANELAPPGAPETAGAAPKPTLFLPPRPSALGDA